MTLAGARKGPSRTLGRQHCRRIDKYSEMDLHRVWRLVWDTTHPGLPYMPAREAHGLTPWWEESGHRGLRLAPCVHVCTCHVCTDAA